jgi:NAD(P)-dependent dehydrogenase (short-subunit alcohol dehydrogenase family)
MPTASELKSRALEGAARVKARAQKLVERAQTIDARASVDAAKARVDRAVRAVKSVDATAMARNASRAVRARVDVDASAVTMMWLATACVVARAVSGVDARACAVLSMASRVIVRRTVVGTHDALMVVDRFLATFAKNLAPRASALAAGSLEARLLGRALRFVRGAESALEVKAVLVTVLMAFAMRVFLALTIKEAPSREVKVVLVTGGSGGLGGELLSGIREAFPGAVVYGTSRKGWSAKEASNDTEETGMGGFFGFVASPAAKLLQRSASQKNVRRADDAAGAQPLGATIEGGEVVSQPLLKMDVTDEESIKECVDAIVRRHGKIDVLINNAGVCLASWAKQTPRADADSIMQTNFLGVVDVINHAMPHLAKGANVINIGSIAGRIGIPYQSLYSASKAALMVYTDALRMETKCSGVHVSLVEPGDLQPGMASVFKAKGFDRDPVAVRAERIMREEEAAGTKPGVVVKTVIKAIKSRAPKNRYLVGPDSWLVETLTRVCSYSAKEYFLASHYRIPPRDKAWIRV